MKKSSTSVSTHLLGATNPNHLKLVTLGTFLSFFVFLGSFFTTESTLFLFTGTNSNMFLASGIEYQTRPYPGFSGPAPAPGGIDFNGNSYTEGIRTNPSTGRAWADLNGDGKISKEEAAWWDKFFQEGKEKSKNQPAGGGAKLPSGNTPTPQQDASLNTEYGCLSATGC